MTDIDALVEWTAEAAWHLSGPDAVEWLARIEDRYPAIFRALDQCWHDGSEAGLIIAINLTEFWLQSYRSKRARYLLERMLPATGTTTLLRVHALRSLARLHEAEKCPVEMRAALRAADETYSELGFDGGGQRRSVAVPTEPTKGGQPMTDIDALVEWTAEAASHLSGPDAEAVLARIEGRYGVILLTLERCSRGSGQQVEAGVRMAVNLEEFWIRTRRAERGRELLRTMLPHCRSSTALHGEALRCDQRLADAERALADMRSGVVDSHPASSATGEELAREVLRHRIRALEERMAEPRSQPERRTMSMTDIEELTAWTAEAASHLSGPDQTIWLARIEARLSEIFLQFARHQGVPSKPLDASLRIIINLEPFWILSVRSMRGLEWLRRLLPFHQQATPLHADALMCQGRLSLAELRFADAMNSALEAGQIYRDLGNGGGVAGAFDLFYAAERRTKGAVVPEELKMPPMLDVLALVEWTAEAASHLAGPAQAEWLARIDERQPEIVFAIHRGSSTWNARVEAGLRIATNLGRYWWMRGRAGWARAVLNDLLIVCDRLTPLQADGLLALAGLNYAESCYAEAKRSCLQACAIYRALSHNAGHAASLNQLGMAEREAGDLATARTHHEHARALYLALGDERGSVSCLSNLGVVALFEGNLDAAEELHEAALAERRRLGDVRGIASSLGSLATIARLRDDTERAGEMHEEALTLRRDLGDPWGVAGSLLNLGLVAIQRGDLARASDLLGEATAGFAKVGDRLGVCETLDARASLTFGENLPAEAVRLFAVARTARKKIGAPLPPVYCKEVDRCLEACKARLGAKAFDAAWKLGLSAQYSPFPLTTSEVP